MWILGFIIAHDNDAPFLDKTEWLTLLDKVEHYTLTEQDLRGWVEGKAWAHSCAHVASVLCLLAKSRYADAAIHERILMLTAAKMTLQVDHVYSHGEDDRMATVVTAVVEHGLLGMGVF